MVEFLLNFDLKTVILIKNRKAFFEELVSKFFRSGSGKQKSRRSPHCRRYGCCPSTTVIIVAAVATVAVRFPQIPHPAQTATSRPVLSGSHG